jgi:imidazolonepropionase-like amidohydrolase
VRTLRAVANARRTLRAGFTTVRNLGLFIQTGGLLLDVALKKAIDLGWIDGPRIVPAGHAITPTGGHLDPTMFQAFAPHIMELTVEEGHRQRDQRGPQGGAVPDQARRPGDQGLRLRCG